MFKRVTSSLRLCNYSRLGHKSWTRPTSASSQRLVAVSMRMCDLYIQTNDLVASYWFAGNLDARVNETLMSRITPTKFINKIIKIPTKFMNKKIEVIQISWIIHEIIFHPLETQKNFFRSEILSIIIFYKLSKLGTSSSFESLLGAENHDLVGHKSVFLCLGKFLPLIDT